MLNTHFKLFTIQLGDKRVGHYVKLVAFSVVISVNISMALVLVELFYY